MFIQLHVFYFPLLLPVSPLGRCGSSKMVKAKNLNGLHCVIAVALSFSRDVYKSVMKRCCKLHKRVACCHCVVGCQA